MLVWISSVYDLSATETVVAGELNDTTFVNASEQWTVSQQSWEVVTEDSSTNVIMRFRAHLSVQSNNSKWGDLFIIPCSAWYTITEGNSGHSGGIGGELFTLKLNQNGFASGWFYVETQRSPLTQEDAHKVNYVRFLLGDSMHIPIESLLEVIDAKHIVTSDYGE